MKRIKDTKIGAFLKDKAPNVLNIVGDLLPDAGALGVIKNIIDMSVPDAKDKAILLAEIQSMEIEYLKDVQNARDMYAKTDHKIADEIATNVILRNIWMAIALTIIEILSVIFIDDKILIAIISSAVASIVTALINERQQVIGFHFGSSAGSKAKSKQLEK